MNKKIIFAVLACILSIVACRTGGGNSTPTPIMQMPTANQTEEEMTREYLIVQTVIAGEQATNTPTPVVSSAPPAQWTELFTKSPTVPSKTYTPTPRFTLTPGLILTSTQVPVDTAPPPKPTKPAPTPIPPVPTPVPHTPAPTDSSQ